MSIDFLTARKLVESVSHWHHRFEIHPGISTPGSYDPTLLWSKLAIEGRCKDRTFLDIGASDGFFSSKIDKLGGLVTAVDFRTKNMHGFEVMEKFQEKEFSYIHSNLYDVNPEEIGRFDTVLFLGVLYHLPDMMMALRKLRMLCKETLFIETHSDNDFCKEFSAARYYKSTTLAGDVTNFWSPNTQCVLDMLYDAGFDVIRKEAWSDRLFVEAKISLDHERDYKMSIAYGKL